MKPMAALVVLVLVTGTYAQVQGDTGYDIQCPWPCPDYDDSVCGNNGKTYQNQCYLYEAAACENSCIKERHPGPCETQCPEVCFEIYQPVCGSDGNTYDNPCYLAMETCRNPCIELLHDGECSGGGGGGTSDDCRKLRVCLVKQPLCGSDGVTYVSQCHLDHAACSNPCIKKVADGPCDRACGDRCPVLQPPQEVCGSDGNTYPSQCHLQEAACHDPCLVMQHAGPCEDPGCQILCPLHYDPVCGSDGVTYGNTCGLNAAGQCKDSCITFRANGPCRRECGDDCPLLYGQEVCGSDGITYPTLCHLEEAACDNPCLVVQHRGRCETPDCPVVCPLNIQPVFVCGSNGKTYSSPCLLNADSQCVDPCITLKADGPCKRFCGDRCPLPLPHQSVCGSDGTTYPSLCHLEEAACSNPCLVVQHQGPCSGSETCCFTGEMGLPASNLLLKCEQGTITALDFGIPDIIPHFCEFAGRRYLIGTEIDNFCFPMTCTFEGWVHTGAISDCCSHCHLHGDLHVFTFDYNQYDFYKACNYTVTQTGSSYNPSMGVFTTTKPCKNQGPPCFGHTTFRNDPHTVITIRHDDLSAVSVNGHYFEIGEEGVPIQVVQTATGDAPVLAWRGDCGIYLAGSSGIVVLACPYRLDVWASSSLVNQLGGLCGHYDKNPENDFTTRGGTVFPVKSWSFAFPDSWRTDEQGHDDCGSTIYASGLSIGPLDPCDANEMWRSVYKNTCEKPLSFPEVSPATYNYRPLVYDKKSYILTCVSDVCLMHNGGSTHYAIQQWLHILRKNYVVSRSLGEKVATTVSGTGGNTTPGIAGYGPTTVLEHCLTSTTSQGTKYPQPTSYCTPSTVTTTTTSTTTFTTSTTLIITRLTTTTTTHTTTDTTTRIITTCPIYTTCHYNSFVTYTNPSTKWPFIPDTYATYIDNTDPYTTTTSSYTFPYTTNTTYAIPNSYPTIPNPSATIPNHYGTIPNHYATIPNPYTTPNPYTPNRCEIETKGCPQRCVPRGQCKSNQFELTWPYLCGEGCACCI